MNQLSHGSINGPKLDDGSPAKIMADKDRAKRAVIKQEQDRALWLYCLERE